MVFKRRHPLTFLQHARGWVWPQNGWSRASKYVVHRLKRLPETPHRIAAGLAAGAAVSFTPFVGLHLIVGGALCFLVRGNLFAMAIGTAVGNPWTFPFIWLWIFQFGRWLQGHGGVISERPPMSIQSIFEQPLEFLLPMTLGGLITAVFVWLLVFFPAKAVVARYQSARRMHLRRRARRRMRRRQKEIEALRAAAAAAVEAEDRAPLVGDKRLKSL